HTHTHTKTYTAHTHTQPTHTHTHPHRTHTHTHTHTAPRHTHTPHTHTHTHTPHTHTHTHTHSPHTHTQPMHSFPMPSKVKDIIGWVEMLNRFPVKTPLLYYNITDLYVRSDISCGCVIRAKNSMKCRSDGGRRLILRNRPRAHTTRYDGEREGDIRRYGP